MLLNLSKYFFFMDTEICMFSKTVQESDKKLK